MDLLRIASAFLIVTFAFGCSFLMIGSAPSLRSYKYYDKNFKFPSNSALRLDGFYRGTYFAEPDSNLYYLYIRFYVDGRVNSKMAKRESPELIHESNWIFNHIFGYYQIEGNNLAYELKSRYGTYEHATGQIVNDTLMLNVYEKQSKGHTTYSAKYIFHEGFAL